MIGKRIGRYEILSELGRGANGVVWKARHTLLPDRLVALKVLSEALWSDSQALQRFLQEAIAASKLDHPGIATLYDAERLDGQLYIAFKFIDGETVAKRTEPGGMALRAAASIGRDAALALAHAHGQGVIHRDLSPGNVMVDRQGRGVLVDFGLARSVEQSVTATAGVIVGTLPYMAPEVLRGEGATARSDIYGLGAVVYRMVTGRAPYEGRQPEEVAYQILNGRVAPPSAWRRGVSEDLDDAILRALERNPSDRYADATGLANAFERILENPRLIDGETDRTRLGRLRSTIGRALRRRKTRWVSAAIVAAIAVATLVGVVSLKRWRATPLARAPVVAVLPPRNQSQDPDETAYIGEAFGEDLVARLGQVSKLHLLPWLTSQRFGSPGQSLQGIGEELHADELIVGSYRSDGEQIRVRVDLVDARSGRTTWSRAFVEPSADLVGLQATVGSEIVSRLRVPLSKEERASLAVPESRSPEAYEYYARGAAFMNSPDVSLQALAGPYFEKALDLDASLAQAWVGAGAVRTDRYFRGQGSREDLATAEADFRRALDSNPRLYAAVRGLIRVYNERGDHEAVLRLGKQYENLDQDVEALLIRGWAYTLGGLPDKAVPIFDRVRQLDPAGNAAPWYQVVAETWAGETSRALDDGKAYTVKFGPDPELYTWLGVCAYANGQDERARDFLWNALKLFGRDQSDLYSVVYATLCFGTFGERARADSLASAWLAILDKRHTSFPTNHRVELYRAWLADFVGRSDRIALRNELRADSTGSGARMFWQYESLRGFESVTELRRIMRESLQSSERGGEFSLGIYASVRQAWLHRYPEVLRWPEYQALVTAAQRSHDALAAKY